MDKVVSQYRCTSDWSVIFQSTLSSVKKPVFRHEQTHRVLLPLEPHEGHVALVAIVIQPLTISEWPGCVFWAAGIRAIHCCCFTVLEAVGKQIGGTIGRVYPEVTIDISKAVQSAPLFQLPVAW